MSAFSTAFTQFFTALTLLFSAFSRMAATADNLASVAESTSGIYKDQAIHDQRVAATKRLQERMQITSTEPITTV